MYAGSPDVVIGVDYGIMGTGLALGTRGQCTMLKVSAGKEPVLPLGGVGLGSVQGAAQLISG